MSISFQGTKNGVQHALSMTYAVVSESSTTFKVNVNYTLKVAHTATIWILTNGTVLAAERGGKNYTGSAASAFVLGAFADLNTLYTLAVQASTITPYFHSAGTSTVTIGTNSFTVTDYVANTTPETIQGCNGDSFLIDAYSVYLGTPTGSSLEMITSANFSSTITTPSGNTTLDYSYQLTALTVA
jgi:hypothetical protein